METLLLDRAMHGIHDLPSLEEFEHIIKVPYVIWNSIVAEKDPNNKIDCLEWMKKSTANAPYEVKKLSDFMIRRKRNHFSQYQYYIAKYKFYYDTQTNEIRLRVESTLPKFIPEQNI